MTIPNRCYPSPQLFCAGASDQEAEFWAKLKSLEVQFWQTKNTVADASSQLRDWVREAFSTLESVGKIITLSITLVTE